MGMEQGSWWGWSRDPGGVREEIPVGAEWEFQWEQSGILAGMEQEFQRERSGITAPTWSQRAICRVFQRDTPVVRSRLVLPRKTTRLTRWFLQLASCKAGRSSGIPLGARKALSLLPSPHPWEIPALPFHTCPWTSPNSHFLEDWGEFRHLPLHSHKCPFYTNP